MYTNPFPTGSGEALLFPGTEAAPLISSAVAMYLLRGDKCFSPRWQYILSAVTIAGAHCKNRPSDMAFCPSAPTFYGEEPYAAGRAKGRYWGRQGAMRAEKHGIGKQNRAIHLAHLRIFTNFAEL